MKKKILYVEDEPFLGKVVKETLEFRGYEVLLKNDGAKVLAGFDEFSPDVCVLDVMLPNVDGFTLCNKIREKHPRMPVIFLTAKNQTEDVVRGFDVGGTDYIRKPFSIEELILRIENQLKLHRNLSPEISGDKEIFRLGNFEYSPTEYELRSDGKIIRLSNREAQVLNMLVAHANEIVDRKKLLKDVWGDDSFFNSRNLDVYIRKLRDYFLTDPDIRIITLKGTGYRFVVPV
jgi:DNA-binding response OmpR family regulator